MLPKKIINITYWHEIFSIAVGGAMGSVLRFLVSSWVQGRTQNRYFPFGILTVNLIGCFLIGVLFGIFIDHLKINPIIRSGMFIGFLGGFTTFSSFSMDVVQLFSSNSYGLALSYILMSVIFGILATFLGLKLVNFF